MTKEETIQIIRENSIIPIATIDSSKKANSLAEALISGGISVIEVTLRTEDALDSISEITRNNDKICVGAGTVKTTSQCETAIKNGASFIVSPGFNEKLAQYCIEKDVLYIPGCITPSEITKSLDYNMNIVKFFPANMNNGVKGMKALTGPFPEVSFIPTCGINFDNVDEFIREPFVLAAGGSWVCPKDLIESENYKRITELCQMTREKILGYEFHHLGINCNGEDEAKSFCMQMKNMFNLPYKSGNSSDFASSKIEVKKINGKGSKGHIAIGTNSIYSAIADLKKRGFDFDEESAVYKNERLIAIYLKNEIFGYAIHLSQR